MGGDDDKGTKALAGAAAISSIAALIVTLTRPAKAAAPPPNGIPPITVILDEEIRLALAAMLEQQLKTREDLGDIYNSLDTLNNTANDIYRVVISISQTLVGISEILGIKPPEEKRFILDTFQLDNQTLQSGTPFPVYEKSPGKGALIWAVVDVSSPNAKLQFRFDDLVWEFEYSKLYDQGIDRPLAPGVWLSKYDAVNSHFATIFSAGTVDGFPFKERLLVTVTYTGTGTATLNQGRGVALIGV